MSVKEQIAHDKTLDNTLNLLQEGYLFIKNRMDHFECDILETHLLGEKVICVSGEDAAKIFYDNDLFKRKGAAPKRVQEVRRCYPFTPFIGARVKKSFIWNQCEFNEGTLVLLDVYGMNHDSRIWDNPEEFHPERFKDREENLFNFIPQGGGDPSKGHRCPGEGITIEIMKTCLDFLCNKIEYEIQEQDLSYNLSKIPTLPDSGFVISNIRRSRL